MTFKCSSIFACMLLLLSSLLPAAAASPQLATGAAAAAPDDSEELKRQIGALGNTPQTRPLLCGQAEQVLGPSGIECFFVGRCAHRWRFSTSSPQTVEAIVRTNFPGKLSLLGGQGQTLATRAIESDGAVLQRPSTAPGTYMFEVEATRNNPANRYAISLLCGNRCVNDASNLCLNHGRFRVEARWENQFDGTSGSGRALRRGDAAGQFSFGDPSNVELLVKILGFADGTYKVFYGELTDLHFTLAVTDMLDGEQRTKVYANTTGDCGGVDDDFLGASGGAAPVTASAPAAASPAGRGQCRASSDTLCLMKRRFALTLNWTNQFTGKSGKGVASPMTDLTGGFYFTDRGNPEVVAKIVDLGDRIAVFYAALSNLEYDLTVRDTQTGQVKSYHNPAGRYCGGRDGEAFE
jgi:hypothetical protein